MTLPKFHRLANMLPLIEGDEFEAFVEDVRVNGILHPTVMYEDQVLDGRNRERAGDRLGIVPQRVQFTGSDPAAFVMSANLHRRHLTLNQRAMAAAQYATLTAGRPAKGKIPTAVGISNDEAAKVVGGGISSKSVERAKFILAHGTQQEIDDVKQDRASLANTANVIRKREPRRAAAPKKKRNPDRKAVEQNVETQRQQFRAAGAHAMRERALIWNRLRDAMDAINSLQRPGDVADMVAKIAKVPAIIDARLGRATRWLQEFEHEWAKRRTSSSSAA